MFQPSRKKKRTGPFQKKLGVRGEGDRKNPIKLNNNGRRRQFSLVEKGGNIIYRNGGRISFLGGGGFHIL